MKKLNSLIVYFFAMVLIGCGGGNTDIGVDTGIPL